MINKRLVILSGFTAMTLCDLIPKRQITYRSLPKLFFFTHKVSHHCRTLLVALIYLYRAKSCLTKRAVGSDDIPHRLFLGSILIASKFLGIHLPLTNRWLCEISRMYSIEEMNQIECAFLKLIQYQCWIDNKDLKTLYSSFRLFKFICCQ